jgi:hypothetical protein
MSFQENKEEIIRRYLAGESLRSLGIAFNLNNGTIHYYLDKLNLLRKEGVKNYGLLVSKKEEIIKMYNEGMTGGQIAKAVGASKPGVCKYMKELGLSLEKFSDIREDPLKNHTEEIIKMYQDGLSTIKIAASFNASDVSIWTLLNKHGVDTSKVLYKFDETFFDKIDNHGKAWFLGLMLSDGNNRGDDTIRLEMTDLDIIEKVRQLIGFEGEIIIKKGRKVNHKDIHCLAISRKGLSDKLTQLGCPVNKTFINKFPSVDILPSELYPSFCRGYLDGDGSVCINGRSNYINFTGTKHILSGIESAIGQKFGWYNRYPEKGDDYNIRTITLSERNLVKDILRYIYKDSDESIRGNRKYGNACVIWAKPDVVKKEVLS